MFTFHEKCVMRCLKNRPMRSNLSGVHLNVKQLFWDNFHNHILKARLGSLCYVGIKSICLITS